jgi:hypothetical protein
MSEAAGYDDAALARRMLDWTITKDTLKGTDDDAHARALTVLAILAGYSPQYVLDSPGGHLIVPQQRLREICQALAARRA